MKLVSAAKLATLLFMLIAIAAGSKYAWDHRKPLFTHFTGQKIVVDASRIPIPSPATKTQLTQFADSSPMIMGVNVIRVDFQQNTRATTFRYFKEPAVEEAWLAYLATIKAPTPLFGDEEGNNQRLVALINGQFSCVRTLDTTAGRVIPTINQHSLATCMAPIPPGYGDFVGFINIFLRSQPTGAEIQELNGLTNQIAKDFYERDIVKSTQKFTINQ